MWDKCETWAFNVYHPCITTWMISQVSWRPKPKLISITGCSSFDTIAVHLISNYNKRKLYFKIFKGLHWVWDNFWLLKTLTKRWKILFILCLKAVFILEIFTILFRHFSYIEKRIDKKVMVNFKICDVRD